MSISIELAKHWSQFLGQEMELSDYEDFRKVYTEKFVGVDYTNDYPYKVLRDEFEYIREPQPKLKSVDDFDWSTAPEWVNWIVVQPSGHLYMFDKVPELFPKDQWYWAKNKHHIDKFFYDASDWENSRRERPSNKSSCQEIPDDSEKIELLEDDYTWPHEIHPVKVTNQQNKAINAILKKLGMVKT